MGLNKNELDDFITHDWREDIEFNIDCEFYNQDDDICTFKTYEENEKIFGKGCLGKSCRFYKINHKKEHKE